MRSKDPEDRTYLDYFNIMFGPWDRLDSNKPFINSLPKPPGANYFPPDLTRGEFESWLASHPEDKEAFESNFSVIRRKGKSLAAIPYSDHYTDALIRIADDLRQAAVLTSDPSLEKYLSSRADALLANNYYQSDMDWMDMSGDLEVVIGPYEVYEDNLLGYKAAFESFICVVDHESSLQLKAIADRTKEMEAALPLSDRYRYGGRGDDSPIKVVNLLYSAGDTKAGVQTAAFNLPNDERVREAKGSKKVLLKNVMKAKFENCWIPIVRQALSEKDLARVTFDAYFTHVLLHEISHGLGPGTIRKDSGETTVNRELKDLYSTIEECKADVLGITLCEYLIGKGVLPEELASTLHASNLGGMFRSIRFGIDEAHGGGVAIQLNFLLEKDAFRIDENGRFSVNDRKISGAMKDLAAELLRIEAEGDYGRASAFIGKYRFLSPAVAAVLDRLSDVPVDIRPVYPIEKELETEAE
jgi:hypothetical protein